MQAISCCVKHAPCENEDYETEIGQQNISQQNKVSVERGYVHD